MLPKRRLNKEDSSMKPISKLLVLREKSNLRKPELLLRPEDSSMRLLLKKPDKKRKPDIKPG